MHLKKGAWIKVSINKKVLVVAMVAVLLMGCAAPVNQEAEDQTVTTDAINVGTTSSNNRTIRLVIKNNTNFDFYEMYISSENNDSWGEDLLMGNIIKQDDNITGSFNLNNEDTKWDVRICDQDGNTLDFEGMNVDNSESRTAITLEFNYSEENGYILVIE